MTFVQSAVPCAVTRSGVSASGHVSLGRILVVEDEPIVGKLMCRLLRRAGHMVELATDGEVAIERLRDLEFDAVVTDVGMPGLDGIALLELVHRVDMELPIILVTGLPSQEGAARALRDNAFAYMGKPVDTDHLRQVVAQAVEHYATARARRSAVDLVKAEREHVSSRLDLELGFTRAMSRLFMAYQPIVCWSRRSVRGYEALVRSRDSSMPHPGALFDAAEKLSRLTELSRGIRSICTDPFDDAPDSALLFVNLHTHDLADEELYDPESPLVKMADRVVLEITERARLDRVPDVQERIGRLRGLGFRIAIDDIGAGYAGLTSFALLEPDVVKLDMALVRGIDASATKQKLVQSLISLCTELGLDVVAEGVETPAELRTLVRLGCDLFQGYLFARPGDPFPEPRFDVQDG